MYIKCILSISLIFLAGQGRPPPLPGQRRAIATIERAAKRAEEYEKVKKTRLRYIKDLIEEDIKDDGTSEVKKKKTYLVFPYKDGETLERLIAVNDQPVEDSEPGSSLSFGGISMKFDQDFLKRYDYFASEKPNLHFWEDPIKKTRYITAFPVDFKPKPDLADKSLFDPVANRLSGTIYIDGKNNTWKVEGSMAGEASYYWGIAGKVYSCKIELKFKKFEGTMVGDRMVVDIKYRIVIKKGSKRVTFVYRDYEKVSPATK